MTDTHRLFVYGTLRDRDYDPQPATLHGVAKDLTWRYPTITVDHPESAVDGQLIEVEHIASMDRYEGHHPGEPERSLYWRLPIGDSGAEVYVGNPDYRYLDRTWAVADHTREEMIEALADAELEIRANAEVGK